jgi:hypothetical protein
MQLGVGKTIFAIANVSERTDLAVVTRLLIYTKFSTKDLGEIHDAINMPLVLGPDTVNVSLRITEAPIIAHITSNGCLSAEYNISISETLYSRRN